MENVHDSLTMLQVSGTKSVEVCADGIFETSNQHEGQSSLQTSQENAVDKEDRFAAIVVSDTAQSDTSGSEPSGMAPTTSEAQAHAQQVISAEDGDSVSSESFGVDSEKTSEEQNSFDEPAIDMSPPPSSTTSASSDIINPNKPTLTDPGPNQEEKTESIEDSLSVVETFLISKIQENQVSSHAQEIHEFVTLHLSDKQRKLHFPGLVQRIVTHFGDDAHARGLDDVSVDAQSSICLLEQTFLTLGRVSPLQDIYTAEEEDMLDQLGVGVLSSREAIDYSQPVV